MSLKGAARLGDHNGEEIVIFKEDLIDESTWGKSGENQSIRQKIIQFVQKPKNAFIMDAISTLLNLATISLYIRYLDRIHHVIDGDNNKLQSYYLLFLKASHVFFLVDYLLRLFTAKIIKNFLFSMDSFVEILTIMPFLSIGLTSTNINGDWFRFCMMMDTLRTMQCKRIFYQMDVVFKMNQARLTEKREIAELTLIIFTSVVFPSAFLTWVETLESYPNMVSDDGVDNSFFLQVYFVLTTMSVVGYGSSLTSVYSQVFITFFLLYTLYRIPNTFAEIMERMRSKSQWARAKYEKLSADQNYVVLIGDISDSSLINFLSEFFHEDHG